MNINQLENILRNVRTVNNHLKTIDKQAEVELLEQAIRELKDLHNKEMGWK